MPVTFDNEPAKLYETDAAHEPQTVAGWVRVNGTWQHVTFHKGREDIIMGRNFMIVWKRFVRRKATE